MNGQTLLRHRLLRHRRSHVRQGIPTTSGTHPRRQAGLKARPRIRHRRRGGSRHRRRGRPHAAGRRLKRRTQPRHPRTPATPTAAAATLATASGTAHRLRQLAKHRGRARGAWPVGSGGIACGLRAWRRLTARSAHRVFGSSRCFWRSIRTGVRRSWISTVLWGARCLTILRRPLTIGFCPVLALFCAVFSARRFRCV
jgi:hypothetical protein